MMRRYLVAGLLLFAIRANAQDIKEKLDKQVKAFVADTTMRAAIVGFYVADAKTGEEIYNWNGQMGLAPASTQKIVTSVAAFELLGKDYRYSTDFMASNAGKKITGLFISAHGDPTLGSWRYRSTSEDAIADSISQSLIKMGYNAIEGNIFCYQNKFEIVNTPGGWIHDDMGNYYGAGTNAVNWKENQFDVSLITGKKEGDPVEAYPADDYAIDLNALRTGKKGSGDNAYLYYDKTGKLIIAGTAESASGKLTISGATEPEVYIGKRMSALLNARMQSPVNVSGAILYDSTISQDVVIPAPGVPSFTIYKHYSPSLDSIVYWFMKRSINLYGEALMKTIGYEKAGVGSTDSGIAVVKRFYKEKGFDLSSLKIIDGSGLSPSNRVTAEGLCKVLLYAKQQSWFDAFAQAFPRYNNMMLKSGTIAGAKSYAGYHTSSSGKEYVVAIIVNNYDGLAAAVERKMFQVLDVLK